MNERFEQRGPADMSPDAIAQRLRDLQQLYLFSMSLSRAKFVDSTQAEMTQAEMTQAGLPQAGMTQAGNAQAATSTSQSTADPESI